MPRRTKPEHVYGPAPMIRTVEGLKAYKNPLTRFAHDRVETRDFQAKAYVFCRVKHGEFECDMIFGWRAPDEPEFFRGDSVKVVTMTPAECAELSKHLRSSVGRSDLKLSFW